MNLMIKLAKAFYVMSQHNVMQYKTGKFWNEQDQETLEDGTEKFTVPKELVRIILTFIFILTRKTASTAIPFEGGSAPITDYQFPTVWWEIAKGRQVFWSESAFGRNPYFEFKADLQDVKFASPAAVERFWTSFNKDQLDTATEGKAISKLTVGVVNPQDFNTPAVIWDFKGLMCGSDLMADGNANGTIDQKVAQILDIQHPGKQDQLYVTSVDIESEVQKWSISMTW